MKSPFKKLRGFGLGSKTKKQQEAELDEVSQASKDMQHIKDCYDTLLSSAAATANSTYEFSESLGEIGDCLLQKTSLNDDTGKAVQMLGKGQFQIQKLLDNYRSHILRTITIPSESLLNELLVVEEMKKQCEVKRMVYDEMKHKHKERRRLGLGRNKGEYVSSKQVQAAKEEFEEDATLFVFRIKSLKGGQSRSLLTQAARHHAAQVTSFFMSFFRKALKSLETIDPYIQVVTKQHHIDYQFSGLEDDDRDSRNDPMNQVSSSENSMELADLTFPQVNSVKEQRKPLWNSSTYNIAVNTSSKSAPLSVQSNIEPREKFRQSSVRKLNTYVLPTPLDGNPRFTDTPQPASTRCSDRNIWHSSPLKTNKFEEKVKFSPSNKNSKPTQLPSPLQYQYPFGDNNVKTYSFSVPIAATPHSSSSLLNSGKLVSGNFVSSPKINELHELPRPPANLVSPSKGGGFSAPLVTFKDSNKSPDAASVTESSRS
ncbi:hypothetical protein M8C21_026944 [Ambrosia artemisiifolia]|uniref:BAR domain-containing protein n=1 Tax=Ambrosia artemisiifolia TaxID=4212 RepID=A0AAD5BRS9_AMBAR|nr:hypothetical protein M8C21_026944 [Ambrosia artemisiifolia]